MLAMPILTWAMTSLEVSSASNCEAYQARRGKIRFRPEPGEDGVVEAG